MALALILAPEPEPFQFLIGSMKLDVINVPTITIRFQFLIGSMK